MPGAWPGQVDDLEAGDLVALLQGLRDRDRPAVPALQEVREQELAERVRGAPSGSSARRRRPRRRPARPRGRGPARPSAGATPRWSACPWPSTTRVMPPSCAPAAAHARSSSADAGVEQRARRRRPRPGRRSSSCRGSRRARTHTPSATSSRPRTPSLAPTFVFVLNARFSRSRTRALRRHQAELARDGHAVDVGVVARRSRRRGRSTTSQPSMSSARAGRLDALEGPGPAKVPRARQRYGGAVVLGPSSRRPRRRGRGTAPKQLVEEVAHAVGRGRVDLPAHVLAAARGASRATAASTSRAVIASK